MISGDSFGE